MSTPPTVKSGTKIIRYVGLAVLVLMGLIPPWQMSYSVDGLKQSQPAGYRPIWKPPAEEAKVEEDATEMGYRVNVVRLAIPMGVVLVAMNAGIYALRKA